ncbi:MAG TPA: STAS domain-containing protein [archaeon]|nr:STAS domain-containing protein [archaeon]
MRADTSCQGEGRTEGTLKITFQEQPELTILRLDGRVVGPWVQELDRAWRSAAACRGSKRLLIDLCGVTYADSDGRQVLAEIHQATGAEFKTDTPMGQYIAAEATREKRGPKGE